MADRRPDTDTDLARLLARLPREIEPETDLWPGIAKALAGLPIAQDSIAQDSIARDSIARDSVDAAIFDRIAADIEPDVDLWPGIEAQIRREGRRGPLNAARHRYWFLAACLAVAAIAGTLLVRGPESGPATGPDMTSNRPGSRDVPDSGGSFRSDLLFPSSGSPYAREIQETLREHISAVRSERLRIEESLDRYPSDAALRQLWQSTYAAELKLIDTAGRALSTI
jgi:hypothetical protein